jgi:predicted RNase H-like HicB family nuclease
MAAMKTYKVRLERDESGNWIATVPAIPGCHSYGRNLDEARRRIRQAMALFVRDASRATLEDDIRLTPQMARLRRDALAARQRADRQSARAAAATREAARVLTRDLRIGVRDAGRLLGVSHQRIHQLLEE